MLVTYSFNYLLSYYYIFTKLTGIREINDLLQDDELDDDDAMKNNNPENNKKKRLPKCPQCSGTGKYMWKGNHFTLSFT